jgi:predicted transposase/invertase (TIGR01784 family)
MSIIKKGELLNPLDDLVFKLLMTDEETLIGFLKTVLSPSDSENLETIEIIEDSTLLKEKLKERGARLDILATKKDGTKINIEVQLTDKKNMEKRTLFYWGKTFLKGIQSGEDFKNLKKVITINILDFKYLDLEKIHTTFHLWEDGQKDFLLTDLIEIHFIEMGKFKEHKQEINLAEPLYRWLYLFDETIPKEKRKEVAQMDTATEKAMKKLENLSSDEYTLALLEMREDAARERISSENAIREEERIKTAMEMLKDGIKLEKIADYTKLPLDKLKELEKQIKEENS